MKKILMTTAFALMATGAMAQGGFHGPQQDGAQGHPKGHFKQGGFVDQNQPISRAADANKWVDDQFVVLQGKIVKQLSKNDYLFQDESGEVRVEIDRRAWRGLDVSPNDEIKIYGEVDIERQGLEIDVDRIEKIK